MLVCNRLGQLLSFKFYENLRGERFREISWNLVLLHLVKSGSENLLGIKPSKNFILSVSNDTVMMLGEPCLSKG